LTFAFTLYVYRRKEQAGVIWFIFAGAFFLVAVLTYVTNSRQPATPISPAPVQAAPEAPPSGSHPAPETPHPLAPAPTIPTPAKKDVARAAEIEQMINTTLSLSSSQPNVGILFDAAAPETEGSAAEVLRSYLGSESSVRLIFDFADTAALKSHGFLTQLYGGNAALLTEVLRLSRLDYINLVKAGYSFRQQPELDQDLVTCDLVLTYRLVDRSGQTVQSGRLSAAGPGFTRSTALDIAAERTASQLREKVFASIR
jgi:hypothetical protein